MANPSSNKKDIGILNRLSNSMVRGGIENAEFLSNLPVQLIKPATFILKKFGPEKLKEFLRSHEDYTNSPLSTLAKKAGILRNLPAPESYKEKVFENLGDILGSSATGGAISGYKALRTLSGVLSELTGLGVQALVAPKIQEMLPENDIGQFVGNILAGLAGRKVGTKVAGKIQPSIPATLPEKTYAQTLPIGSPEWRKQAIQEFDLAKRDVKSGALKQDIQKNQHEKIEKSFPHTKIKAHEVVDNIVNNIRKQKESLSKTYNKGLKQVFDGYTNPKNKFDPKTGKRLPHYKTINTDRTKTYLDELIAAEPEGNEGFRDYLTKLIKEVDLQDGNPIKLNALKKRLAAKTKYGSHTPLYEGEAKNTLTQGVIKRITDDLKDQVPGYKNIMKRVGDKYEALEELYEGPIQSYVKSASKDPKSFIDKIFENKNEEIIDQFKSYIAPKLYDKAAQSYLRNIKEESLSKTIRGFENQDTRLFDLRGKLENPALQYSLPDKWKNFAKNTAKEIHISEMASPRGDIAINAGRGIEVGDESKLLGKAKDIFGKSAPSLIGAGLGYGVAGPAGAGIGAGAAQVGEKLWNIGKQNLQRNQMLTGESPRKQVVDIMERSAQKVIPQTIMAAKMAGKEDAHELSESPEINEYRLFLNQYNSQKPIASASPQINKRSEIDDYRDYLNELKNTKSISLSKGSEQKRIPVINPGPNEPNYMYPRS